MRNSAILVIRYVQEGEHRILEHNILGKVLIVSITLCWQGVSIITWLEIIWFVSDSVYCKPWLGQYDQFDLARLRRAWECNLCLRRMNARTVFYWDSAVDGELDCTSLRQSMSAHKIHDTLRRYGLCWADYRRTIIGWRIAQEPCDWIQPDAP